MTMRYASILESNFQPRWPESIRIAAKCPFYVKVKKKQKELSTTNLLTYDLELKEFDKNIEPSENIW